MTEISPDRRSSKKIGATAQDRVERALWTVLTWKAAWRQRLSQGMTPDSGSEKQSLFHSRPMRPQARQPHSGEGRPKGPDSHDIILQWTPMTQASSCGPRKASLEEAFTGFSGALPTPHTDSGEPLEGNSLAGELDMWLPLPQCQPEWASGAGGFPERNSSSPPPTSTGTP